MKTIKAETLERLFRYLGLDDPEGLGAKLNAQRAGNKQIQARDPSVLRRERS